MKVVVAGGHGLIGSRLAWDLAERGHVVVAVSRRTGVDTMTGAGLDSALAGCDTLVDVTNASSFEEPYVTEFFQRSTQNLVDAAARAGVKHHIALSVVGTPRLIESPYFRAKAIQERILARSGNPHTLVRATQFFEFMANIIPAGIGTGPVAVSPALVQPIAARDVAAILADVVEDGPTTKLTEVAGPELHRLCDLVQWVMYAFQDSRPMTADPAARYYGAVLDNDTLTPSRYVRHGRRGQTYFGDWLDELLGAGKRPPPVRHPNPFSRDQIAGEPVPRAMGRKWIGNSTPIRAPAKPR